MQGETLFAFVDGIAYPVRRIDPDGYPFSVDFSADGEWLVGTNDDVLFSWNGPGTSLVEQPCDGCSVTYVDTADGTGFGAVLRDDGQLTQVDPATLDRGEQRSLELPNTNPNYEYFGLQGDVNGMLLVSHPRDFPSAYGGPDTLWLIDPATGTVRAAYDSEDNTAIRQVAVSVDGGQVAITSYSHGGACYETGHVTVSTQTT